MLQNQGWLKPNMPTYYWGFTDLVFDKELIITTIEEQKRPVMPIIHLFMLVAWNHQGD